MLENVHHCHNMILPMAVGNALRRRTEHCHYMFRYIRIRSQDLEGDISAKPDEPLSAMEQQGERQSLLLIFDQANGGVGSISQFSNDAITGVFQGVAEMNRMVFSRPIILKPFRRSGERMKTPLG